MTRPNHASALCVAIATLSIATSARAGDLETIAVVDLQDKGVGAQLASNLSDIVTASLTRLGVFQVLSRADIQKLVEFEADRQTLGCDDAACLAEIGGALGVAMLVSGSVGMVGDAYVISLSLTNTRTVEVVNRENRNVTDVSKLPDEVAAAAKFLVRSLLAGKQGDLILTSAESGAEVEIDGRLVGVTPLGRQALAGGPHKVAVHKDGFVSWAKDIDITADQPVVVEATLVPSLNQIADYDSRAFTWRLVAYATGGAALGLVGFGAFGMAWNSGRAGEYERDIDAVQCRVGQRPPDASACGAFTTRRGDIQGFHIGALIALAAGGALGVASAFFFLQGPEVGAYDAYKTSVSASLQVVPTEGGFAAGATLRF